MKLNLWTHDIEKKSKRARRGFPAATLIFYGPDNKRATKVVVGIVPHEAANPNPLRKWFARDLDARVDRHIGREVVAFLREHHVQRVVTVEGIFGCPHEEGVDYPEGEACSECPYWAEHDRFDQS
jgi:hypothetical protein